MLRPLACIPGDRFVYTNKPPKEEDEEDENHNHEGEESESDQAPSEDEEAKEGENNPRACLSDDQVLKFFQPKNKSNEQYMFECFLRLENFHRHFYSTAGQKDVQWLKS